MAFRAVIQKHLRPGEVLPEVPAVKPVVAIDEVQFLQSTSIFSVLPAPVVSPRPMTFEELHQAYGFVLYRTTLTGGKKGELVVKGLRDYALVFVNGRRACILDRRHGDSSVSVEMPGGRLCWIFWLRIWDGSISVLIYWKIRKVSRRECCLTVRS
ncbi:hypothetical protein ACQ86N_29150 [Puia sp. P3]|uniref:hypothetical protein n=1 Tax=Puia sp. P3 TaxID=3423952 RepID=UPI003D67E674